MSVVNDPASEQASGVPVAVVPLQGLASSQPRARSQATLIVAGVLLVSLIAIFVYILAASDNATCRFENIVRSIEGDEESLDCSSVYSLRRPSTQAVG